MQRLTWQCNSLGVPRSATHTPIFQTFFDYRQGMRKKQPWGNCELELLSFQASKVPYDLALDIIDDAGDADCLLMLIVREDMYSKQDAEVLLQSYGQLVKAFAESPHVRFDEPDIYAKSEVERSLAFGRGLWNPKAPCCYIPFLFAFNLESLKASGYEI